MEDPTSKHRTAGCTEPQKNPVPCLPPVWAERSLLESELLSSRPAFLQGKDWSESPRQREMLNALPHDTTVPVPPLPWRVMWLWASLFNFLSPSSHLWNDSDKTCPILLGKTKPADDPRCSRHPCPTHGFLTMSMGRLWWGTSPFEV